jgi:exopolysaccharide biosynthesis protein
VQPTPAPAGAAVDPAPDPDAWLELTPGLERRTAQMTVPGVDEPIPVELVRIDPTHFVFQVHYAPDRAATISQWQARTGAMVIVNGGFFNTGTHETQALVVSDGERFAGSYTRQGGMFSVVGEEVRVRSLVQEPYRAGEPLDQAVQGLPMLIEPGGQPVQFRFSRDTARRTALGQDADGRIVIAVVDEPVVDLYTWRDWLITLPGLALDAAINLDGGSSSGLAVLAWDGALLIDSHGVVPTVIAITPRP